jgi:hypothetical protein
MTILRMRIACWIPKATNTHTQVLQYSLILHCNNGCTNAPRCYVIRTLSVLRSHHKITELYCIVSCSLTAGTHNDLLARMCVLSFTELEYRRRSGLAVICTDNSTAV